MFECVQEFIISSFNEYCDHAPLHLVLDIRCYNNAVNRDHAGHGSVRKTCSWRPGCIDQCSKSLTQNIEMLNGIVNSAVSSQLCIDKMVEDFTNIICDIMTPYCKGNQYSHSYDTVNKEKHNVNLLDNIKPDKPWFDDNLKHLYKDYKSTLAVFNRCKSSYNHEVLRQTKQLYKDT